jgi:L-ascorbate metabolism protein UlaG (beta-lactamase superfamily)
MMKITKYEHACLVVEENGQSLVIDPGFYTTNLQVPENVMGVVITHEHQDHLDKDHLKAIFDKNPDAKIIAHEEVTNQLDEFKTVPAVPNEGMKVGDFELEFFGGDHAFIFPDKHVCANLGVLINGKLYYPGDSFSEPDDRDITVLALPVSAPWLKFSEVAEFVPKVKAKQAFPTHDAILSDAGKALMDRLVGGICESAGTEYRRIDDSGLEV